MTVREANFTTSGTTTLWHTRYAAHAMSAVSSIITTVVITSAMPEPTPMWPSHSSMVLTKSFISLSFLLLIAPKGVPVGSGATQPPQLRPAEGFAHPVLKRTPL